jgi:hypothetical protein
MGNEAQNLMASMGIKPKEQRIAEMAGAVTRLIINDTIKEAKKRAQVRDSNTQPQKVEKHSQNG